MVVRKGFQSKRYNGLKGKERVVEAHWLPQSEEACCLNEYVSYPTMLMVQVFFPFRPWVFH